MLLDEWAELYKELKTIESRGIKFYLHKRIMANYNSWILCCKIDSSILEDIWEDIVDCVAVHLQAKLTSQIERSNIYILFFLNEEVSSKLKRKIEYNRYCCRKIIINENLPTCDVDRQNKIESLIFYIEDYKFEGELNTFTKWLEEHDLSLVKIYREYEKSASIENAFKLYINS